MNAIERLKHVKKCIEIGEHHVDKGMALGICFDIETVLALLREECEWKIIEPTFYTYNTECGKECVDFGNLEDRKIIGCPFCVKRIKEIR